MPEPSYPFRPLGPRPSFSRPILDHALSAPPEKTLFHYTTQLGLLGILKTQEIWATHTQHLNDSREFKHAVGVFRQEVASLVGSCQHDDRRNCLKEIERACLHSSGNINICVACFSEDADSLSQWRSYAGKNGFSLGFRGNHLAGLVQTEDAYLAPCIYDEARQREVARALIEEIADINCGIVAAPQSSYMGSSPFLDFFNVHHHFAPLFKHPSFADEKEWRIIVGPVNCERERYDFRPGPSMITPFYRFPLMTRDQSLGISELVIGPNPHEQRAAEAAQNMLLKYRLKNVRISKSEVPYRNW